MKKIKSYTGIWNVEKVLYAINDFTLPFPVTFTQITWFVITEFAVILLGDLPPLSLIEGALQLLEIADYVCLATKSDLCRKSREAGKGSVQRTRHGG